MFELPPSAGEPPVNVGGVFGKYFPKSADETFLKLGIF